MLIIIINERENSLLSMDFQNFIYLCPANEPVACGPFDAEMLDYVMVSDVQDVGDSFPIALFCT